MIIKYIQFLRLKRKFRLLSLSLLEEFNEIISDTLNKYSEILNDQSINENVKFEGVALLFWLFNKVNIMPVNHRHITLNLMHDHYYKELKKSGYSNDVRRSMSDELNKRYMMYNEVYESERGLGRVYSYFVSHIENKLSVELGIEYMDIPMYIHEKYMELIDDIIDDSKTK